MPEILDAEFGAIKIRRSALSKSIRLKLDAGGSLTVSMPKRTPLFMAKQLINEARQNIRGNLSQISQKRARYQNGDLIGKTHTLQIKYAPAEASSAIKGTLLEVTIPEDLDESSSEAQAVIHEGIVKALRQQAKAYLPRRISQLADTHDFTYDKLRFSSAGTRWGSCSTEGTISLNIWLMHLPFELIDYVLLHELCHTKEMNHSPTFWELVEACSPDYKQHRKTLKQFHPYA